MAEMTAADENLLAEVPAPGEGMLAAHTSANLRPVIFIALVAIVFTIGFSAVRLPWGVSPGSVVLSETGPV